MEIEGDAKAYFLIMSYAGGREENRIGYKRYPQGGGSYQLKQYNGGNTKISVEDAMEFVNHGGATPEDIVNGLEDTEVQPKDKAV